MSASKTEQILRVAIVGSGPAGFYAADALLSQSEVPVQVNMFERLPTPFGLVRAGVAPDHQSVKKVVKAYERSAARPNFHFFGNVALGRDIQVEDLTAHHDQIIYAVGNEADRRLGIPGEDLLGVHPASVFVGWYNAHPDYREAKFDLTAERVAVIGNGNVAVDVTRILSRDEHDLRQTDIAEHALRALAKSGVREITLLGRGGPVQATFTPKEVRELGQMHGADPVVAPGEIALDALSQAALDAADEKSAPQKNMALLREFAERGQGTNPQKIRFRFLVSPVELLGDDEGKITKIRLEKNALVETEDGAPRSRGTGEFEEIDVEMVFVSIGYQGTPLPGVPFDEKRGIIANRDGRVVVAETDEVVANQYVVGWAQSGPRGLIGSHRAASGAVAKLMLEDFAAGTAPARDLGDPSAVETLLRERGIDVISFVDWKIIDQIETNRGERRGAPRVKFTRVEDMLTATGKREDPDWH